MEVLLSKHLNLLTECETFFSSSRFMEIPIDIQPYTSLRCTAYDLTYIHYEMINTINSVNLCHLVSTK